MYFVSALPWCMISVSSYHCDILGKIHLGRYLCILVRCLYHGARWIHHLHVSSEPFFGSPFEFVVLPLPHQWLVPRAYITYVLSCEGAPSCALLLHRVCMPLTMFYQISACSLSIRSVNFQWGSQPLHHDMWTVPWDLRKPAYLYFHCLCFDATLGFPGEGPCSTWTCCTANIDAIQTHPDCLQWDCDVIALQETRINQNNLKHVSFELGKSNRALCHGGLLDPKKTKANTFVTPHGGVALIATKGLIRAFTVDDDSTGLWADLAKSTRIAASWIQILPKVRALIFSFYGETARHDNSHLRVNNFYLERIFAVASQFGDIPIILNGDFQTDPDSYSAVVSAKQHGNWVDPLSSHDQHGNPTRPITFSRNANFVSPTEHFSSIDAILLNRTASFALTSIDVDYSRAKQHAPIVAKFVWPKIFVKGTVLNMPAPLNLEKLPRKENNELDLEKISVNAERIWKNDFHSKCTSGNDDQDWEQINNFALETLTSSGAKFRPGLATRAKKPTFSSSTPCPGQTLYGDALTKSIAELVNFNKLLVEFCHRLTRPSSCDNDRKITHKLQIKIVKRASSFKIPLTGLESSPSISQIKDLQKQVCDLINKKRNSAKRERIKNWKQKMIFGTKTKNVHSFVYKWIKSKTHIEVPNLIVDASGNILYNPSEAIEEINIQWDKVFSANVCHQDPLELLKFIWPYIDEVRQQTEVPELSGLMLRKQILCRKVNAAAGLDGWRTVEALSLPTFVYDKIATFFRGIEDGSRKMPKQLAMAKQVLLNKNGLDDPMQKRIISLLPIFLLAYTGARFKQLQKWQQAVFPTELKGGIKGRGLGEIPANLRLCIDVAKEDNHPVVGIKLDKSKCFDRIVPSIAATLLLGFGCPKGVVSVFLGIYSTLTRFLRYKQWCSDRPTTCANGVVQGCSFSLLAINAYMSAWALLLKRIPDIQFAAFVDDCYIWSRLCHCSNLTNALDVTDKWDDLTGQKLNRKKCQAFATNTNARKVLKQQLPDVDHTHVITVLGVNLNVTNNKNMLWPNEKTIKILRDMKSIRAIPCSREVTAHLIATKVIPQLDFMPSLNHIPKKVLQAVQDAIASSLWGNRPLWRSRWLVLGLLSNPGRTEPFLARSFSTILETLNFLKTTTPKNREIWKTLASKPSIQVNSYLAAFLQACSVLGLVLLDPFTLQIAALPQVNLPILDFTKRDLKVLLCNLCRHQCYVRACQTVRKDTRPANALLDFDITKAAHAVLKNQTTSGMRLTAFRDSTIVGCTITNDRCFKVGFSKEPTCRFCGLQKETMQHLVSECTSIPGHHTKPTCPDWLGPNFEILGVAEIDFDNALQRLQISDPYSFEVQAWSLDDVNNSCEVWTDGSCEYSNMYWHTLGGFAVIDHKDNIVQAGVVHHFALTSFSCELWAVLAAFCGAKGPLHVHTDCDSLVKMIGLFPSLDAIPINWPHFSWFAFLFQIYQSRKSLCNAPLTLEWCPSHILENVPWFLISDATARLHGTTVRDIWHNRTADKIAKSFVKKQTEQGDHTVKETLSQAILWQKWLVHVAVQVSLTRQQDIQSDLQSERETQAVDVEPPKSDVVIPNVSDITPEHPLRVFQYYLPKWQWEPQISNYEWSTSFPDELRPISYASISQQNWEVAVSFFKSLRWHVAEVQKISYVELAYQFHFSGFAFIGVDPTVAKVSTLIRKVINQSMKCDTDFPLVIGSQKHTAISEGKTLPAGFLQGSRPLISNVALKALAVALIRGRTHALSQWNVPF